MKLSEWASIAEIISGVAVVVTLMFLIVGVRENTDIVRASAFSETLGAFNDFSMDVAADPGLRTVYLPYVTGDSSGLNDDERDLLQLLMMVSFRNYERAYFSEQYDLLGDAEWRRLERSLCRSVGMANEADSTTLGLMDSILSEEFMAHVRSACLPGDE